MLLDEQTVRELAHEIESAALAAIEQQGGLGAAASVTTAWAQLDGMRRLLSRAQGSDAERHALATVLAELQQTQERVQIAAVSSVVADNPAVTDQYPRHRAGVLR